MRIVTFTISVGARNSQADLSELLGRNRQVYLERDRERDPVARIDAIRREQDSFVVDLEFPERDVDPYAHAIGEEISPQNARLDPYYSVVMATGVLPASQSLSMVTLAVDDEVLDRCRRKLSERA